MSDGPQLRCYMNLMALHSLPQESSGPRGTFQECLESLSHAGFTGVQFATQGTAEELSACRAHRFGVAASGRINSPSEADALAERMSGDGYECATLHVGWGLEDDDEAHKLIESTLTASQRWQIPLYIETHRATICQDMWRTVQFVRRFPEMRFNGDFSHWYTGQEMVYGGFQRKFDFIQPVLERVRFLHGRIANPGCIQVPIQPQVIDQPSYVEHFKQLWIASFKGFLRDAQRQSHICFTPELLAPEIYYARTFNNAEESDRWRQSLILKEIAERCFLCAQSS
jgi:hypothetical protein